MFLNASSIAFNLNTETLEFQCHMGNSSAIKKLQWNDYHMSNSIFLNKRSLSIFPFKTTNVRVISKMYHYQLHVRHEMSRFFAFDNWQRLRRRTFVSCYIVYAILFPRVLLAETLAFAFKKKPLASLAFLRFLQNLSFFFFAPYSIQLP